MRQRRAYISFPEQHGSDVALLSNQKKIDGVNIRFGVKIFSEAGTPMTTNLTVYNLSREDLEFLSTSAATWLKKKNLMQLYAGYDDDVRLLASGQIMEAVPQGNPDVGLEIRMINGVKWWGENFNVQKSDVKIMDLIDEVGSKMGWTVNVSDNLRNNNEMLNTVIPEYSFTGSPFQMLEQLQQKVGGFSMDEKGVNITTCNDEIFVWSVGEGANGMPIMLINKNTGMVGYPHPTAAGVSVKILLDPNVRTGQLVRVESDRVSFINGDYYITTIQHDGELRGNSWYTTLNCSRASNYKGVENE